VAGLGELARLDVDFRHEGTGGVDRPQAARLGVGVTEGATPWAEKTTSSPSGTSVSSSTKIAPRSASCSTTCLLWTISLRTYTGGPCSSRASSTVCTARSTPAQ